LSLLELNGENIGSSFFNIFTSIPLLCFTRPEAEEFIDKSLREAKADFKFEPQEKEYAFSLSGFHPFFLQMACWYLFGAHLEGLSLQERQSFLRLRMVEQVSSHFDYYWQQSDEQEKDALLALALSTKSFQINQFGLRINELKNQYGISEKPIKSLEKRNLIREQKGKIMFFSPLLVDWIKERHIDLSHRISDKNGVNKLIFMGIVFALIVIIVLLIFAPQILERLGLLSASIGQFLIEAQHYIMGALIVVLFLVILLFGLMGKWDAAVALLKRIMKIILG
jgi:hypothetical protein